ncbi:MAG: bifunctional DNA-formamidopyrimidine glycosylase/DNA-(apurinic or apyrimidinic site) lyase [Actinomycetota bacterium]|nr:bifunctional DNA-formamidopyrimidine glycosylase/DNA-(apurinic or apyrimidinic site) lyase [Actinomycetota bacterium]
MPELPEVETLARGIERVIVGKKIEDVYVGSDRIIRDCNSKDFFTSAILGCVVEAVGRYAKYLIVTLSAKDRRLFLIMHMGMSGQLRSSLLTGEELLFDRHSHLRLGFDDSSLLAFYDPRTFGRAFVDFEYDLRLKRPRSLAKLGPDALEANEPLERLLSGRERRTMPIKFQLLDQSLIGGIGNMYGDEVLFHAGINPFVTFGDLSPDEIGRLRVAIKAILSKAIELRGSSLVDRGYRDVAGELGGYQMLHNVYARAGKSCNRCDATIERVVMKGRSTFFCPGCQGSGELTPIDSQRLSRPIERSANHIDIDYMTVSPINLDDGRSFGSVFSSAEANR